MNRREFLRRIGLGAVLAAAAPLLAKVGAAEADAAPCCPEDGAEYVLGERVTEWATGKPLPSIDGSVWDDARWPPDSGYELIGWDSPPTYINTLNTFDTTTDWYADNILLGPGKFVFLPPGAEIEQFSPLPTRVDFRGGTAWKSTVDDE